MISSHDSFALKLLDPDITIYNTNWTKFQKEFDKQASKLVEDNELNSVNVQIMFLKLLKKHNLYDKVGLLKASNDDLTEWSRVKLENDVRVETPCN